MEPLIITEWSCIFERELPIRAIPIQCNGRKAVAVKSVAGWVTKIEAVKFEAPCGKEVELPVRIYIKNAVVPSLEVPDLTALERCTACDAAGDCRALSKWVTHCYIRRVIVYATVPLDFVASYVKTRPIYAFSRNGINAGHCKFRLKKGSACMRCVYESERGIQPEFVSRLRSLLSVLSS